MTPDDARTKFDDAFEGELDAATRAAFDAALVADPELKREWEAFYATMRLVRGVGLDVDTDRASVEPIVEGVHRKLRVRSRGRFYRDRFSTLRQSQLMVPVMLAIVAFVLVAIAWGGHRIVQIAPVDEPASSPPR